MIEQQNLAEIGVFGGSGFYDFLEDKKEIDIDTPYGRPSNKLMLGKIGDKNVAFMPRHDKEHRIVPHKVNYRANVWAMKMAGCKRVISPCAAGSLQKHIKPGDFVVCDQFVDWTDGRKSTFFEGPSAIHVSAADPYCEEMRALAISAGGKLNITTHDKGTVVVINGPRFSTKSESKFFTNQGWEVINMTQYPESYLVKELGMCPVNISLITDYDAGLVGDVPAVTHHEVIQVFNENLDKLKKLLFEMIVNIPHEQNNCNCKNTYSTSKV